MAKRVEALDSRRWADGFLTRLGRYSQRDRRSPPPADVDGEARGRLRRRFARARARTIMLDYDGTLREFERASRSRPCRRPEIRAVLRDLSRRFPRRKCTSSAAPADGTSSSGSDGCRSTSAPSTATSRARRASEWRTLIDLDLSWMRPIERLLRRVAADVPGAHVERKACSVAWHYREAEPEYGSWRAHELLNDLGQHLAGAPRRSCKATAWSRCARRGSTRALYVRRRVSGREGADALRPRPRRRPDRPRPPRRAAVGVGRRARGRAASERARPTAPREHIHIVGPGRGAGVPARAGRGSRSREAART